MTKLRNTFLSLGLAIIASLSFVQPASASPDSDIRQPLEAAGIIVAPITAKAVKLSYDRPSVSSTPAPKMEAPVVAVQYNQPEATTTVTRSAPVAKNETATYPVAATPAVATPTPVVQPRPTPPVQAPSSGRGSAILASAYAQIGITQDCTAMVERALGSVGIITGDIAPLDFLRYGTVVSNPQPGDLIVRAGHVAVYAGNGMAISGGWNGNQTALHPAQYAGGVYVRV